MEDVSLHTFIDASRLAYAAVSYARYGHVSGQISVALVTAKARVTPIKSQQYSECGVRLARNSIKSTHPVDGQYGRNLLDPGSLKTTETACF